MSSGWGLTLITGSSPVPYVHGHAKSLQGLPASPETTTTPSVDSRSPPARRRVANTGRDIPPATRKSLPRLEDISTLQYGTPPHHGPRCKPRLREADPKDRFYLTMQQLTGQVTFWKTPREGIGGKGQPPPKAVMHVVGGYPGVRSTIEKLAGVSGDSHGDVQDGGRQSRRPTGRDGGEGEHERFKYSGIYHARQVDTDFACLTNGRLRSPISAKKSSSSGVGGDFDFDSGCKPRGTKRKRAQDFASDDTGGGVNDNKRKKAKHSNRVYADETPKSVRRMRINTLRRLSGNNRAGTGMCLAPPVVSLTHPGVDTSSVHPLAWRVTDWLLDKGYVPVQASVPCCCTSPALQTSADAVWLNRKTKVLLVIEVKKWNPVKFREADGPITATKSGEGSTAGTRRRLWGCLEAWPNSPFWRSQVQVSATLHLLQVTYDLRGFELEAVVLNLSEHGVGCFPLDRALHAKLPEVLEDISKGCGVLN